MDTPTSTPAIRMRKPRGQGATRREEILAVASRILLEEGVRGATMRRIAAEVGVSPTALYVYFPHKGAILQTISEAIFANLLAEMELSQNGPGTAFELFEATLRKYVAFGLANPDCFRLVFLAPPSMHNVVLSAEIFEAGQSFGILLQGVENMMSAGYFRPGPPLAVAEAVSACINGLITLLLNKTAFMVTQKDELIDRVINVVMKGF